MVELNFLNWYIDIEVIMFKFRLLVLKWVVFKFFINFYSWYYIVLVNDIGYKVILVVLNNFKIVLKIK